MYILDKIVFNNFLKKEIAMKHKFRAIAPIANNGLIFYASTKENLDNLVKKSGFGGRFLIQSYNDLTFVYETLESKVYVGDIDNKDEENYDSYN